MACRKWYHCFKCFSCCLLFQSRRTERNVLTIDGITYIFDGYGILLGVIGNKEMENEGRTLISEDQKVQAADVSSARPTDNEEELHQDKNKPASWRRKNRPAPSNLETIIEEDEH